MADGMWTALSGLRMRQQRMDNIANRLANANTVGFRRQVHLNREHRSSPEHVIVEQAPADMSLRHLPGDHVMVRSDGTRIREEEGAFSHTGRPLDLALMGTKGYFMIEGEQGAELLTRDGRFKISPEGQLQTIDGAAVLGEGGTISLPQDTDPKTISVLSSGELQIGDTVAGKLRLGYAAPQTLEAMGANRFRSAEIAPAVDIEVSQGYQEQSTVNAVQAMVDLIESHRGFDANMKLLTSYKELDQEAIQLLK
jgi:flagellar basal-body rod protein FlgG